MSRILFVTSDLSYGGAEKILSFVAEKMCILGNEVAIANMQEIKSSDRVLLNKISVYEIKTTNIRYIEKVSKLFELNRCVSEYKPDIIISFKTVQNLLSCIVGKIKKVPVIVAERGDPFKDNLRRPRTLLYWHIINGADGAVFQTYGAQAYYKESLQKRSVVIPNPVYDISVQTTDEEENAIVSFGRLDNEQKRYDVMINAFALFHKEHPEYILKIYGTGQDEHIIKQWIKEKKLESSVHLLGYAAEPCKKLKKGNIFLITSDYEGISNALLEAMAAGFPIVTTDSSPGGARMIVKDHENGLIVPVQNERRIADALHEYVVNKELRESCAKNAKKIVDEYSPDLISNKWDAYITKIMKSYSA